MSSEQKADSVLPVAAVLGVIACCGLSALLVAAVGATIAGVAVEAWVLVAVGLVAVAWFAVRRLRGRGC